MLFRIAEGNGFAQPDGEVPVVMARHQDPVGPVPQGHIDHPVHGGVEAVIH